MKKSCSRCGKIHARGECEAKPLGYFQKRDSNADKFRDSRVWRKKAAQILDRDYHCCRLCIKAGIMNSSELSVHHIIPIKANYDKRLDDDNLITLCRYHHEQAEHGRIRKSELAEIAAENLDLTAFLPQK